MSMPLTPADLDRIEALANAATPGPWRIERDELDESFSDEEQEQAFPRAIGPIASWDHALLGTRQEDVRQIEADAAFIAAARQDVPALVAALRELLAPPETVGADGDALITSRGDRLVHVAGGLATLLPAAESRRLAAAVLLAPLTAGLDLAAIEAQAVRAAGTFGHSDHCHHLHCADCPCDGDDGCEAGDWNPGEPDRCECYRDADEVLRVHVPALVATLRALLAPPVGLEDAETFARRLIGASESVTQRALIVMIAEAVTMRDALHAPIHAAERAEAREIAAAAQALLDSLGEYTRQTMAANPEWRSGVLAVEEALLARRKRTREIDRATPSPWEAVVAAEREEAAKARRMADALLRAVAEKDATIAAERESREHAEAANARDDWRVRAGVAERELAAAREELRRLRTPMAEADAPPACLAGEAQTSLPPPPPSLERAYLSVAEAALALRWSLGDARRMSMRAPEHIIAERRTEAQDACERAEHVLWQRGALTASNEALGWAADIEAGRDERLGAIEARARELAAGCEETADQERNYDTEPCSHPGCELCLCPCGLPRSDAYHTPEQRAACREAFPGKDR